MPSRIPDLPQDPSFVVDRGRGLGLLLRFDFRPDFRDIRDWAIAYVGQQHAAVIDDLSRTSKARHMVRQPPF